jgi:hypothetical protein
MSLTITQLQAARQILESEIAAFAKSRLDEFSDKTGLQVDDLCINVNSCLIPRQINERYHVKVKADVKV